MPEFRVKPRHKPLPWRHIDKPTPALAKAEWLRKYGKQAKIASADELRVIDMQGLEVVSRHAFTPLTTHDDSLFVRTALVVDFGTEGGSFDLVDKEGRRLCQINAFALRGPEGVRQLMVDVIDVDERFPHRGVFVFPGSGKKTGTKQRKFLKAGTIVGADFRNTPHESKEK